jgi:hypothetical protein
LAIRIERALAACLVFGVALSGCGTAAGQRDATASAQRFEQALRANDGAAACRELSSDVTSSLESSEKKPCDQAILAAGLKPASGVEGVTVWETGAQVKLGGDTLFLDETDEGWKISAAGCKLTTQDQPYDCDLKD